MLNRWVVMWATGLVGACLVAAGAQEKTHNNLRRVDEARVSGQPSESEAKAFLEDAENRLFEVGVKRNARAGSRKILLPRTPSRLRRMPESKRIR